MTGHSLPPAIGRYIVLRFLARGGMGALYVAHDPILERDVAIKLLRDADDPLLRARFTREAKSAANLRHRHVVTIFDVGDHEGQPFIAMELVEGPTFAELIRTQASLRLDRKLGLIEDLCAGLAYAHDNGIIHRDVKPANLMIDADDRLKILDFGIARAVEDSAMTQTGHLVGSANYMSPEQVANRPLDGRSDMFAVGAVFFELLSGRQAFEAPVVAAVLHKILNEPPQDLRQLCPNLDPRIVAIVEKALAKQPEDRFASLHELRGEVAEVRDSLTREERRDVRGPLPGTLIAPRPTATAGDPQPEATDQRARATVAAARRLFADGHVADALLLLEEFRPAVPVVTQAWMDLSRGGADSSHPEAAGQPEPQPDTPPPPVPVPDAQKPPLPDPTVKAPVARQPAVAAPAQERKRPTTRHPLRVPLALAALLVVVVSVAALWNYQRDVIPSAPPPQSPPDVANPSDPPNEPDPPVSAPTTVGERAAAEDQPGRGADTVAKEDGAAERLTRLRDDAQRRLDTGDERGALALLVEGLALRPDDPALNGALDGLLTEARRDAFSARDAVAKAPSANQSVRIEGARTLELAEQARLARRRETAIRTFWTAAELFAAARPVTAPIDTAAADPVPPAPRPESPAPRQPSSPPDPEEREDRAPVTPSVAVATPPPAAPSRPAPAAAAPTPSPEAAKEEARRRSLNDQNAILATLAQYAQGYSALNVAAVTQVFPSVDRAGLERAFGDLRAQEFRILSSQVSQDGTRATVVARVLQSFTPRVGEGRSGERNVEFRLEKSGERWLIVTRQ
jgi:predicted Ser/Thr protein kinase